jgi:hypothetical protein
MQSNFLSVRRWLAALMVAALLVLAGAAVLGGLTQPATAAPAAQFGAVASPRTVTLYGPTAVTTGTTFSSAPLNVNGIDNARITNYARADVFVWTDAGSSGTVTVTVQASPDETTWANLTEMQHGFMTGTLVSTAYTYRVVLSGASAAGVIRAPLAGEFVRVQVTAAGAVTPTVKATLR